jgi:outer membrane protein TolC
LLAANPRLASMRAMVDMAVASVDVARRAGTPDYTAGLMAEVRADPSFLRPLATATLPLWRDKVAATLASAQAGRRSAEARLGAEEIAMAAELARTLVMLREADRRCAYIDRDALPNLSHAQASAEAGYGSGAGGFAPLTELRLMRLDLELDRAAARRDRETALADLSRLAAGDVPSAGLRADPSSSP